MKKYSDFEDFLSEKFSQENPMVLDDEWPDAYSDWVGNLDVNDVIAWANEYGKTKANG